MALRGSSAFRLLCHSENMAALIRFFTRQSPGFTGNADSVSESLGFDQHLKPLVEDWLRIKYNSQAERAELIAEENAHMSALRA